MPDSQRKSPRVHVRRTAVAWRFQWTDELVELLGVLPDAAVAARAGISSRAVLTERRRRGIPPPRPRRPPIEWTQAMLALLGTDSDPAVGRALGIHESSVALKRRQLGIPPAHPPPRRNRRWFPWKSEELALLGKVSDGEVARILGLAKATVVRKRNQLGLPPFQPGPRRIEWTPAIIERLGEEPDAKVADELGISVDSVSRKRKGLGISASQEKLPVERNEEVAKLLLLPDTEVKRRTGLAWQTIRRLREDLGIEESGLDSPGAAPAPLPVYGHPRPRERCASSNVASVRSRSWRRGYRWRPEEVALLGSMPDEELAVRLGRTTTAVRKKRQVVATARRPLLRWQSHEIELLGAAPDSEIGTRLVVRQSSSDTLGIFGYPCIRQGFPGRCHDGEEVRRGAERSGAAAA